MVKRRFDALDGLKGIAILAVVFTHIPLDVWFKIFPANLGAFFSPIVGGGAVGVTIFFLLTGFLMGFLHPAPSSAIEFYSKRYARLFPAFLVMVTSFTIFTLVKIPVYQEITIVIACMVAAHLIWKIYPVVNEHILRGRGIIHAVLILQAAAALWYVFYLLKVPSPVFYFDWGFLARGFATFAVNATMTLPFGNYIGQLDGVYWALCAEVFFYLLYPIVIIRMVTLVNRRFSLAGKALFLITLFPFSYGLYLIGKDTLGFGLLQLQLTIYFIVGVFIGTNQIVLRRKLKKLDFLFTNPVWIVSLLLLIFGSVIINSVLSDFFKLWWLVLTVIPVGLLLITAFSVPEKSKNILHFSAFTFLGKYSFAIFLTHSFVIHEVQKYIHPDNLIESVKIILLALAGTLILAWLLHRFTERPYFVSRQNPSIKKEGGRESPSVLSFNRTIVLTVAIFTVIYFTYRPPLALFTFVYQHGGLDFRKIFNEEAVTLTNEPFRQQFTARYENLGMFMNHLRKNQVPGIEGGFVPFRLTARLFSENNQEISEASYDAWEISDALYFPFGFPVQTDSKGENYNVEYQLSEKGISQEIKLIKSDPGVSVYFVDKKSLIKNPKALFFWGIHKLGEPFINPMFWLTAILVTPFIFIMLFYQMKMLKQKR